MPLRPLKVPDLGLSDTPIKLTGWLLEAGAQLSAGERVAELLAGEVLVELTSPWSGRLAQRCALAEQTVAVGETLAQIETDDRRFA